MDDETTKKFVMLSCLKLIRILRLSRLIDYLNQSDDFKLQLKLAKMCFFVLVYLHFTTCLWFLIIEIANDAADEKDVDDSMCGKGHSEYSWVPA